MGSVILNRARVENNILSLFTTWLGQVDTLSKPNIQGALKEMQEIFGAVWIYKHLCEVFPPLWQMNRFKNTSSPWTAWAIPIEIYRAWPGNEAAKETNEIFPPLLWTKSLHLSLKGGAKRILCFAFLGFVPPSFVIQMATGIGAKENIVCLLPPSERVIF